jgi:hypothetical protein
VDRKIHKKNSTQANRRQCSDLRAIHLKYKTKMGMGRKNKNQIFAP